MLQGASKIKIKQRSVVESRAVIRGDLALISIGQNCILGRLEVEDSSTR